MYCFGKGVLEGGRKESTKQMNELLFVTNKGAWSINMKYFLFVLVTGIPLIIRTVPLVTEIFHDCCSFVHSLVSLG